jgi:predicted DNA-binding transcriptional regulator YafY
VPRNAEVIRQWTVLREIENARAAGVTIDDLAQLCAVTTRTIRRDLEALQAAGFPLYDDRSSDDGRTRWRVNGQAFKGLSAGLTMAELCALYFSRTLVESLSGTPFRSDVERAFEKLTSALTPHMRQFVDQLPRVIATKADPMRRQDDPRRQAIVARALEATVHQRQATLTYHSKSSDRTKSYLVHPYRLAYAQGGMYLLAYVPEYNQVRTFAAERIQAITVLEDRFTPIEDLPDTAFPHSLGVHSGPPQRVEVEFAPVVADYLRARVWHPSQQVRESGDGGGVVVTLNVCLDRALHSWILSFGPFARVIAPDSLAREIAGQLSEATARYTS